jgi:hypothetical protein
MPMTNDEMVRLSHVRMFLLRYARPSTVVELIDSATDGEAPAYVVRMLHETYVALAGEMNHELNDE